MEDLKHLAEDHIKAATARLEEYSVPDQKRVDDLEPLKTSFKNFEGDHVDCWNQHVESMKSLTMVVHQAVVLSASLNEPELFNRSAMARDIFKVLSGERVRFARSAV